MIRWIYFVHFLAPINFQIIFWTGIVCRPAVLSIPYLILLFYAPFLPFAPKRLTSNDTKCFLKCSIVLSSLIVLLQACLQFALLANNMDTPQSLGTLGRHLQSIGLVELYNSEYVHYFLNYLLRILNMSNYIFCSGRFQSFCWCFLMDVTLCGASIFALIFFNKLSTMERSNDIEESIILDNIFIRSKYLKSKSFVILEAIGNQTFIRMNRHVFIYMEFFRFDSDILCAVNNIARGNITTINTEFCVFCYIFACDYNLVNE